MRGESRPKSKSKEREVESSKQERNDINGNKISSCRRPKSRIKRDRSHADGDKEKKRGEQETQHIKSFDADGKEGGGRSPQ